MARTARSCDFDPNVIGIYHCTNRCVRRAFLCGFDPYTGTDYEHRRSWIEKRLEFLAGLFGIDVAGYAVLSNHFHVILRNRPDIVESWTDFEVARRWLMLCPVRKTKDGSPATPNEFEINSIVNDAERVIELRSRLSDISWFMRMVSERVARRANAEDQVGGRFWQGRFGMRELCDEVALLACLLYVDLNPIHAGIADAPEDSEFTSVKHRIDGNAKPRGTADWLGELTLDESLPPGPHHASSSHRCSDKGFLSIGLADYLVLLDWTGRQSRPGKSSTIASDAEPILKRLGIEPQNLATAVTQFDHLFFRKVGTPGTLVERAKQHGRRWYQAPGGHLLGSPVA